MRAILGRIGRRDLIAGAAILLALGAIGWRVAQDAASEAATPVAAGDEIGRLRAAAEASPGEAKGWQMLGFTLFDQGRFGEAGDAYRKATRAAPGNAVLWSSLGEALVMASERDPMPADALAAFRKAVELDPDDPRGRYFLAVKRDLDGDHRGAIDDWLALLADTPAGAPWEADLRRTIEQVGKINGIEVGGRVETALAGRPAEAHPAFNAIPGPSEEQLAQAGSIPPGQQRAMAESMVASLAAKLEDDPANMDGWIMLMRSYKTLGRDSEAAGALAAAMRANPGRAQDLRSAAASLGIGRP